MNSIETIDLTKKFGEKTVVDKLNLTIGQGELFALLGVNGAGKTTTIRMLSCLIKPTSGDAYILGDSITANPFGVKQNINISPQETAVAPNLTVKENLELIAGIYFSKRKEASQKADEIIMAFGLEQIVRDKAKTLSGGWQRRLSIAMALISSPKILFLDEPTLGLDVLARRELWHAIQELKGKITILLTTHYLEEVEALADRAAVMAKGKLKAVGTVAQLIEKTGAGNFEDAFVSLAAEIGVIK
jgi:ABC-2 type transport system ATP-binding protein